MAQTVIIRIVTATQHEVEVADDFDFTDVDAVDELVRDTAQLETDDISDLATTITFADGEEIDV